MITKKLLKLAGVASVGLLVAYAPEAHAAAAVTNFGTISSTVTAGISSIPGLLTAICYLFGVLLIILGILKIKEHVEKPDQTPVKEGMVRLIIGGALFGLPLVIDAALGSFTNGVVGPGTTSAKLKKVTFNVE